MSRGPALQRSGAAKRQWEAVYASKGAIEVSWYEAEPETSLALIDQLRLAPSAAIIDVGGGASSLAGRLIARGFADITVLDVSARALELARAELGANATRVHWIEHDLLSWAPQRRYDLWHDRAVFHFLVDRAPRERYADILRSALRTGGKVVIGTFAADGPANCSGLPVARYDAEALTTDSAPGWRRSRRAANSTERRPTPYSHSHGSRSNAHLADPREHRTNAWHAAATRARMSLDSDKPGLIRVPVWMAPAPLTALEWSTACAS